MNSDSAASGPMIFSHTALTVSRMLSLKAMSALKGWNAIMRPDESVVNKAESGGLSTENELHT